MHPIFAVALSLVGAHVATLLALWLRLSWQARRDGTVLELTSRMPLDGVLDLDYQGADGSRTRLRITTRSQPGQECHGTARTC